MRTTKQVARWSSPEPPPPMTLPPPNPALRVCVVVTTRNEEELIGSCLRALAVQEGVSYDEYEILHVLDHCTDGTQVRAREVAASYPALRLYSLDGPKKGSGHARRVGMENACNRLHAVGRPHALISSTDGDTVVATDWISAQLAAAARGARAIGGRIELADNGSLRKVGALAVLRRLHGPYGGGLTEGRRPRVQGHARGRATRVRPAQTRRSHRTPALGAGCHLGATSGPCQPGPARDLSAVARFLEVDE